MSLDKGKVKASSYGNISSSSLASLTAEISKQKQAKAAGSQLNAKQAAKGRKLPLWARKNSGVEQRQARDQQASAEPSGAPSSSSRGPSAAGEDSPDGARARAMLEKKAQLYEKIQKGKSAGLSEGKIQSLLVDFDRKNFDNPDDSASESSASASDSDSDSDDDRRRPSSSALQEDLVEYIDDFGRTRLVPRSELPRGAPVHADPSAHEYAYGAAPSNVFYGDQHTFPVYEPAADVLAAKRAALAEHEPLVAHFDGAQEIRTKGAGFYQFSLDEDERKRQMDDLKRRRVETEVRREENLGRDEVEERRAREREGEMHAARERRGEHERKRTAAKVGFVEERNPKFSRAE